MWTFPNFFLILEMDAFDFALGVVFSQFKENDILHLVDFCFCNKKLDEL
jgi:hypothetical protein